MHGLPKQTVSWFPLAFLLAMTIGFEVPLAAEPPLTGSVTPLQFNRDIRPILADTCFACHGADSATREAGLRLDIREEAIDMAAIVPGKIDESEMVSRLGLADDDEMRMPPPSSHKNLTKEQKEILTRWIAEGAEYEAHWAFIPPTRPVVPEVAQPEWIVNPIDAFVLDRLTSAGLLPSISADRRTLARRASLDVIGLPPEPQWVEEFLADDQPGAYERYVDRLLREPMWGENRARYWLDYARYADTHGIHFDNYREAWAYRDWVIAAFNDNQPFDQFSIDQLAGDLLVNDGNNPESLRRLIATGFNRCNMTTNEGGIIDEEYAVLYARDRVETTSAVWLGLTTGCAACHDHKFDPVSQKDFYSLAAFFNNTTQPVRDGNRPDTPPVIPVPTPEDRERFWELEKQLPETESVLAERRRRVASTGATLEIATAKIAQSLPQTGRLMLHLPLSDATTRTVTAQTKDGLVPITATLADGEPATIAWENGHTGERSLVSQPQTTLAIADAGNFQSSMAFSVAAWVYASPKAKHGSIVAKIDDDQKQKGWDLWLQDNRPAVHLVSEWPGQAIKVLSKDRLPTNQWSHVAFSYDGSGAASGLTIYVNGVTQLKPEVERNTLGDGNLQNEVPLTIGRRLKNSVLGGVRINDVRLYEGVLETEEVQRIVVGTPALYAASLPVADRPAANTKSLVDWKLWHEDGEYRDGMLRLAEIQSERAAILDRGTVASVMHERDEPAMAHVLSRGEYDQRLESVTANVPASLGSLGDRPANRLGLAQWLFAPEHPLTARVTVNRFWQEVFGSGLVRTSADFGITGELPSHPELLDFLAVEFVESGWDVKALFRMMLTSATYRQSAMVRPELLETDPENRLLARGPRFRLEAEPLRDMALWAGGLLAPEIGGPSVRPYQPDGVWEAVAIPGSTTRNYRQDSGDSLYRRSMYTFWKRSAPPASMELLGAPSREVCTIRRERTNTPLQALVVLNDPQFVEAARGLAQLAIQQRPDTGSRLALMASRLLSRPLAPEEQLILGEAIGGLKERFRADPQSAKDLLSLGESPVIDHDPTELAAWTIMASNLLNLDETLCK